MLNQKMLINVSCVAIFFFKCLIKQCISKETGFPKTDGECDLNWLDLLRTAGHIYALKTMVPVLESS